jgi:hypothetical protein
LAEVLCYKPDGHGVDPDEVIEFLSNLYNPSSLTKTPWLTELLTYVSARKSFWSVKRGGHVRDNLAALCEMINYMICDPEYLTNQ